MSRLVETARRSRFLLAALVAGHLIIISGQVDGGEGSSLLGRIILGIASPPQRLVAATVDGLGDLWSAYLGLRGVHQENLRLRSQIGELQTQLQQRQRQAEESERLRALLELKQMLPFKTVTAEVVARDALPWFRSLLLDKGKEAGIHLDTPVIASTGVVGRVVAVGPRIAKVQTLLDNALGVGALIERSRVVGVVSGQLRDLGSKDADPAAPTDPGGVDLVMKYVLANANVVEGDVVVTSGLDRVFPKGLLVGRVRAVGAPVGLFRSVLVTPAARFAELEQVLLVQREEKQPVLSEAVGPEAQ
jgi:rod shape-determining protein MreC